MKRTCFCALLLLVVEACAPMKDETRNPPSGEAYFTSPEEAVVRITEMLRQEDFGTLAGYYDLSDSNVPLEDLESGAFFIRTDRPEVAHPAGFWRYRHPFPPGFTYSGMRSTAREGVFIIRVDTSIDQGADAPQQVGYSRFHMIKSANGWQILPDPAE